MPDQYYVTAEIKPNGDIEVIRIEATPTLEHHHRHTCDHVRFLRSVNQRRRPYGELQTEPLLRALAAWPLAVLKTIASMRYGTLSQETDAMPRGLRPLDAQWPQGDDDGFVAAVTRCALNEASDNDRLLLARKNESGDSMLGPCELVECYKHPGHHKLHRWTWHMPEDGDHLSAIQCGNVGSVSACPMCLQADIDAEDDDGLVAAGAGPDISDPYAMSELIPPTYRTPAIALVLSYLIDWRQAARADRRNERDAAELADALARIRELELQVRLATDRAELQDRCTALSAQLVTERVERLAADLAAAQEQIAELQAGDK